jgi:hypothetical protein
MSGNDNIAGRLDNRRGDPPFARIALKSSDLWKLRARTSRTHFVTLSQNLRRLQRSGAAGLSFGALDFSTRPPGPREPLLKTHVNLTCNCIELFLKERFRRLTPPARMFCSEFAERAKTAKMAKIPFRDQFWPFWPFWHSPKRSVSRSLIRTPSPPKAASDSPRSSRVFDQRQVQGFFSPVGSSRRG